jgi:hypothetical protein
MLFCTIYTLQSFYQMINDLLTKTEECAEMWFRRQERGDLRFKYNYKI